jgi:antitoxin component of MazEF toxin-antitoxin module
MNTHIIAIGTSRGIIIPSGALKELNLSLRSQVRIEVADGSIIIKPTVTDTVRAGWEQDAMLAAQEEDDLADFDTMAEEDLDWWTWK